jgi:acyl transferase domain-containing protein/thioesterase domain-containing protein
MAESRAEDAQTRPPDGEATPAASGDIAIIGMAGRFPGARSIDEFWDNLVHGRESIRVLDDEALLAAGASRRELDHPDYVKRCPVLDDIDKFDAAFFGLSPRDASVMDPAHRFFLEVAWEALEHSGNAGLPRESRVGVFAGSGAPLYWINNVLTNREVMESMGEFLVRHTGNDMNFLATRASYDLDLRGPSINVQTACSSALVALHLARQSLLNNECDMALVGGSTIVVPMGRGYLYKEGEILSPDGHCRPFDHRSAGTVFGSGTGCIVLKRLNDALDNGDCIHAVVKGSAVNNDGSVKVGYLAPGVDGQVEVIGAALAAAAVPAESISYVEAHGTGTSVGDPIELTALQQAFSAQTGRKQFCGIGSVKSNIGHLGEAAAMASLIKVVLALKHRQLPPSLGYERPNPRFDLEDSAFFVTDKLRPWQSPEPLRCGVTALGAGGTNCHVIIEEPPAPLPGDGAKALQLLVLSAKSRAALDRMSENLAAALERQPDIDLADAAFTLSMGRRALGHRRALVARNAAEAIPLLRGQDPTKVGTATADADDPTVVFTFPGGGAQYARMGFDLYQDEPVFRAAVDECLAVIDKELGRDLRALLFAPAHEAEAATRELQRPTLSLPALFSVEYALARLFESWGLKAAAYIGHSMGEYVAACLAGVFSLRDGLRLVMLRGRLFEATEKGNMVGISLPEAEVRSIMPAGLSIAAVNAPDLCVASGPTQLITQLQQALTEREVDWTPIHIDVAAHSSMLEPILAEFRSFCRTIQFHPPQKPIASNLTGAWLTAGEATDPEYWVKHLRNTVRFADCVETVLEGGNRVFLEVGPGRTLTTLAGAQKTKIRHAMNSVRHPKEPANDVAYALLTLGKVWGAGADLDWTALFDGQLRNRIPLPAYPFESKSYWIEPAAGAKIETTDLVKREDLDTWFYSASWEPAPLPGAGSERAKCWLVFVDDDALGQMLIQNLRASQDEPLRIITVRSGKTLRRTGPHGWELAPSSPAQYRELLETLDADGSLPDHIVYMLGLGAHAGPSPQAQAEGARQAGRSRLGAWKDGLLRGLLGKTASPPELLFEDRLVVEFFGPVFLGKALAAVLESGRLSIVTNGAFSVWGEAQDPLKRLNLGPALVIPRELPDLRTRLIDIELDGTDTEGRMQQLSRELLGGDNQTPVALRAPRRWVRRLAPMRLPQPDPQRPWVMEGDVVFITGGLGGIGLVVAEHLARTRKLKLALLSRGGMPAKDGWEALLGAADTPAQTKRRIHQVMQLEALGAQVLCVEGDVGDHQSLSAALYQVRAQLGPVNSVIHAAGVMDDELFQTKTQEAMGRVLAPKVQGTLHLDALIQEELRAFVLFSSVASFLGLPGQIDYTAANAFLDAFAEDRERRHAGRTVVINWNAWRDVGMVVDFRARGSDGPMPSGRCRHPALQSYEPAGAGRRFYTDFSAATHWLLAEHRIKGGQALIPGTGFVELARAAHAELVADAGAGGAGTRSFVEMRGVAFSSPFQVAPDQARRLQIELLPVDEGYAASLRSAGSADPHLTAQLRMQPGEPGGALDLDAIRARCGRLETPRDGFLNQDFVDFGPRWGNIRRIHYGEKEALIELALPPAFAADLEHYAFHPAVMDMATGGAQPLIPGFRKESDFYVPFGYDLIRIFAGLPAHCFSHVTLRPETQGVIAAFDVCLVDESGRRLIEIEGFTMKRVSADAGIMQAAATPGAQDGKRDEVLAALLREAIKPDEGVIAFDRVLSQREATQVIVSSVDVNTWLRGLDSEADRLKAGENGDAGPSFSRPAVSSEYAAPSGSLETELAAIWSKLLGVSQVGVLDDFFELGGNSLIAVRFFARVKKQFGISMPISTLFQAPTLRGLAAHLKEQGVADTGEGDVAAEREFVPFRALLDAPRGQPAPPLERSAEVERWFSVPRWKAKPLESRPQQKAARCWLLFLDDAGIGQRVRRQLVEAGDTVITLREGDGYHKSSDTEYTLVPEQGRSSYDALLKDLAAAGTLPDAILHMWLVTADESFRPGSSFFHRTQERGFYSLLFLAKAMADAEFSRPIDFSLVTNGLHRLQDEAVLHPSKATAVGPCRLFPGEFPRMTSRSVDLVLPSTASKRFARASEASSPTALDELSRMLVSEVTTPGTDDSVLYRRGQRYVQAFEALAPRAAADGAAAFRDGTYVFVGNLGARALTLAHGLSELARVNLVLAGGDAVPDRPQWDAIVASRPETDRTAALLRQLIALEKNCPSLRIEKADITNPEHLVRILDGARDAFGPVRGVIHTVESQGDSPMQLTSDAEVEAVLAAKVQGVQVLAEALKGHQPGFVLLSCQLGSFVGVEGEVTAVAGDAFLNVYAQQNARGLPLMAVNWPPMAGDAPAGDRTTSPEDKRRGGLGISAAETRLALRAIGDKLRGGDDAPQPLILVCPVPLPALTQRGPMRRRSTVVAGRPPGSARDKPANALEERLFTLWQAALGHAAFGARDRFLAQLGGPLDAARLFTHVRNAYKLDAPLGELMRHDSIRDCAAFIESAKQSEKQQGPAKLKHLVAMHPEHTTDKAPFFLVAGMFGNILNLRHLGYLIGTDRDVYGLQARGLYGDEKPHETFEEMAEAYLEEIRQVQPHGPYAIGGFSGGGITAYEMAHRLREAGEKVSILIMLDTPLPQRDPTTAKDRAMVQLIRLKREGPAYVKRWVISRLTWEIEQFRGRFKQVDEGYSPDHFKNDAIEVAFYAALARYRVRPYPDKLTLFRPKLDKAYKVGPNRYLNTDRHLVLEDKGWSRYVQEVEVHEVPGDHDHMVLEPEVRVLAAKMRECIEAAEGSR